MSNDQNVDVEIAKFAQRIEDQGLPAALENLRYRFGNLFDYKPAVSPRLPGFIDEEFRLANPEHPSSAPQRFVRMRAADFINKLAETNPQAIDDSGLEVLHESLFDRTAAVRLALAQTLGKLARPESSPHLQRLIEVEEESDSVRKAAAESLNNCTQYPDYVNEPKAEGIEEVASAVSPGDKQKASKFVRHDEPQMLKDLKESDLYKNHLLPDIKKGEVFPAFRNNRIDFYYGGGKLFSYSDKGFVTHIKYASVLVGKRPYISEDELQKPEHIQSFAAGYTRIKENCARYSGLEAIGVSSVCAGFKNIFKGAAETIIPLDIEISFSTEIEPPMDEQAQIGSRTDRIDLLLFNAETRLLRFYEAKHYSNPELWPKGTNPPQVIEQLSRYQKLVTENQQNIVTQYENYVDLLTQLFDGDMPKPVPKPLGIDETPVLLLAYGYDRQQESRIKALLKDNMQGSPYYSCGTANTDRLGSMWNWKPKRKP